MQQALQDFVDSEFLTLSSEPRPHAQLRVYQACLRYHAHKYRWMAFFDVDEFLALRNRCALMRLEPR